MTDVWSERAEAYRQSREHRSGPDHDLLVEWAEGQTALDVATGGGHAARRLRDAGFDVTTLDPAPGMQADVLAPAEHIPFEDGAFDVVVPPGRSRTFTAPTSSGPYPYHCTYHGNMHGVLVVG